MFRDIHAKVMLSIAILCFLLAGLFHTLLRVDVVYANDFTSGRNPDPHIAWIWKSTNTIAVRF